ncbi:hypothetical protein M434DRAFT_397271 [Hypoxylon sp. CO27-5]|nr:hypothetical protein M434DRAFT_397271 [Hypoxylon sp. CO27-5]
MRSVDWAPLQVTYFGGLPLPVIVIVSVSKHPRTRAAAKFSELTGDLISSELAGINDQ